MIGLVPLAAALAITAGQVDLAATISAEGRAGEAPLAFNQPPEASVMAIVIPGAQLIYRGPRLVLEADYQLRLFWRTVQNEPVPAPLLLHMAGLTLTSHETRRFNTKLTASAFEGSADYTFLPVIYGSGQAALVTVPRLFSVALMGDVEYRATRRVTPEVAFQVSHNQPLGPAQVAAGTPGMTTLYSLPHFTSAGLTPGVGIKVSPVTEATLSTDFRYEYVSGINPVVSSASGGTAGTNTLSIGIVVPTVGTTVRLARQTELKLKLGVAFTRFFSGVQMNPNGVTPDVGVEIKSRVFGTRRTALDLLGSSAVEYYVDPVLAIAAPRGTVTASGQLRFATDWSIGLQGVFSTTLTAHPLPTLPDPTYPDEVTAAVNLPVRHPLNDYATLEFGGRWADRSPFYTAPSFGFHQRQLWVYVMILGTTRSARTVGVAAP
jgi:hypothetical protein